MLAQYPQKLLSPFAQYGDKSDIPAITEQGTNAFSYYSGFPTITGQPLSVGGLPPSREDFNAFANMLSQIAFYWQCGGQVEYSNEIDYPVNARIYANNVEYLCLKENGAGTENGVQEIDNTEYWQAQLLASPYSIGEFKQFLLQSPPEGFLVLNGALIENASATVPNLWNYLQSKEGLAFCISEQEWQTKSTTSPFKGIGGVCAYVLDTSENTIRLPDLRGMYAESAGFEGLEVGGVHRDQIQNITGTLYNSPSRMSFNAVSGAFSSNGPSVSYGGTGSSSATVLQNILFDASNSVRTGTTTKPRAYGMLHCVYVGAYNL